MVCEPSLLEGIREGHFRVVASDIHEEWTIGDFSTLEKAEEAASKKAPSCTFGCIIFDSQKELVALLTV